MIRSTGRTVLGALALLLPTPLKFAALRRLFGWEIASSAQIGLSLFVNVREVRLADGVRIGHFNVFRDLRLLDVSEQAQIGQWNWVTASDYFVRNRADVDVGSLGSFVMGRHSTLSSRHYVDCSGGVSLGAFSAIGGVRSTIFTHQAEVGVPRMEAHPVRIGDYCLLHAHARVTPGSVIGDRCVTAMGAVIVGELSQPNMLYGGVPAKPLKELGDAGWFTRLQGNFDT